jgi:hypothetical protein
VSRSLVAQASLQVESGSSEDSLLRAAALAVESWRRVPNATAHSVAMKLLEWLPVRRIEADPKSPSSPAVVFSPNGRFLVIDSIPAIRLVETSSGRELLRVEEEKGVFPSSPV